MVSTFLDFFSFFSKDKHTGSVNSLDLNPFQANLLASGAADSEIFIWDLNKFSMPMTPGAKAQPLEEVRAVAWNRQVQHILATTGTNLEFSMTYIAPYILYFICISKYSLFYSC